jgi:hypothetical protein
MYSEDGQHQVACLARRGFGLPFFAGLELQVFVFSVISTRSIRQIKYRCFLLTSIVASDMTTNCCEVVGLDIHLG